MKALILNSGTGSRMGSVSYSQPKCMTRLINGQTILSRQIQQLEQAGIREIVITTGPFASVLEQHARHTAKLSHLFFCHNPLYAETNYIYSIFLARELLNDDILMLHGDLVFDDGILEELTMLPSSAMVVSSTSLLPQKDFKAVVTDNRITAVGIDFFDRAVAAQPLYKLNRCDWSTWLMEIVRFVECGQTGCYAENAFNVISDRCECMPFDLMDRLCAEIDTPEDLVRIDTRLKQHGKEYCCENSVHEF